MGLKVTGDDSQNLTLSCVPILFSTLFLPCVINMFLIVKIRILHGNEKQ